MNPNYHEKNKNEFNPGKKLENNKEKRNWSTNVTFPEGIKDQSYEQNQFE